MTTGAISTGKPATPRVRREQVKRALRRRAGRIWGLLLVLALLMPLLVTSVLGGH